MDKGMPAAQLVEPAGDMSLKRSSAGLRGSELVGLGVFVAASFIIPLVAGLVLDSIVHTSPLFLFAGLVVGIGAATFGLYLRLRRYL